ncbi:SGNH/GDSL hydrolase family protein [Sulfurimonas sp. HSL-1656]|uniref:SGNH/GDSL hydrolase family protein n=1 Tax=Thiomicrolovo subterrani TaxID=3131934 RepID=UPI0031F9BA00
MALGDFIAILKNIRDVIKPDIDEKHQQVSNDAGAAAGSAQAAATSEQAVATMKTSVETSEQAVATMKTSVETSEQNAAVSATASETSRQQSGAARDAALAGATLYADEATGRAAVLDGEYFRVAGGSDVFAYLYQRVDTSNSTLIATLPSKSFVNNKILMAQKYRAGLLLGNNLFNKDTIIPNGYVDDNLDGAFVASTGKGVSDYIPVAAGTYYDFSTNISFASFYDEDLNWVAGGFRNVSTAGITAPAGAAFFKITVNDSDLNTFMLSVDATPLNYESYALNVDPSLLGDMNSEITALQAKHFQNDFHDPDLQLTYPYDGTFDNVDYMVADFITRSQINHREEVGNNYAAFIMGIASTAVNLNLGFSKHFLLEKLGYSVGDRVKVGFYFRYPDAGPASTRRIYTGPTLAAYDTITTVDDSEWHWHETYLSDTILNSDNWQGIYLGIRDTIGATEEFHIRGLTITNLDTDTWVGERKSTAIDDANKKALLNLNSFVKFIPPELGLAGSMSQLENTYDQLSQPLLKSVVPVTYPIVGDCFVFEGTQTALTRINFYMGLTDASTGKFSDVYLATNNYIGKYFVQIVLVKVTADATTFNTAHTASGVTRFEYNLPVGEWVKLTTMPTVISSRADLEALKETIQINCTPATGVVKVEVCGLTSVLSETGHCNDVVFATRANDSLFEEKVYASLGDSISAGGNYQRYPAAIHAMTSAVRGIGGTTVINNGGAAWVDADGNYLGRPPEAPPSGTEGVDYFTITSGMCTQDRIDTLPVDADLITIMGGANDWGQDAAIGAIGDAPNDTTVSPTFYGAYKSMIDKIHIRCPNARIIICNITSINSGDNLGVNANGNTVEEFRDAIRTVAKVYGLPVLEVNELGINQHNHTSYSDDGTHPNELYCALIGMMLSNKLYELSYDEVKGV